MFKKAAIFGSLFALTIGTAAAEEPVGTSGGPDINFRGCIAYVDRDFRGAKFTLRGQVNVSFVGSNWNDKISSFACSYYCSLTFYEHRDFKGASDKWGGAISYVGTAWNDDISSLYVRCSR